MSNEEFLRMLFDQIQAYSSTKNVLGDILGFLVKVVEIDNVALTKTKVSLNDGFVVDVSNALLKSGNADIIGEMPWDRFCRDMVQA
tara:strand:+ start:1636 stop:1893 length:258 start_codon:yes stop_codon:yes gene_type:complete